MPENSLQRRHQVILAKRILKADPRRRRDMLAQACAEENAGIFSLSVWLARIAHRAMLEGWGCRGRAAAPVVGHPRPTWRQAVARRRHGPLTALFEGRISGQSLRHTDWSSLKCVSVGDGARTVAPGRRGSGSVPFGEGWPPSHRASVAGARSSAASGGLVGRRFGAHQRWGCVYGWLLGVVCQTRLFEDGTGRPLFPTAVITPIPPPPTVVHPTHP